ncbi:LIC10707 family hydrolase [Leptospira brenneri]|uniref:SGNH/GDSL hydrolase family protein n=1 Tax=Leptospira brenneri TaxID=2023182 RepID=A0A2M9Y6L5_9LEPT|nr:SGNH/GDSL hydrolase family protein [Leptospira brenneri]PJZ47197.1 GDSL family lipase [Leptospira brenneri]TGK95842.1 SGNH/GDSL hydrolase family protein [Leptospira brenneri]
MSRNITAFFSLLAIWISPILADKNAFRTFFPEERQEVEYFINDTDCNTQFSDSHPDSFEPNKTFLTFYGDSLGDFVEEPLYGYFGWDKYLTMMNFGVEWNVQNLAVAGYTTEGVYNLVSRCALSIEKRINFKTSPNVALEIGGNDFWGNSLLLTFMPWKFGSVVDRVIYNTKAILYQLRNPRRNKNILVMGNFPNLSYSPTLGHTNKYFKPLSVHPDVNFSLNMDKLKEEQAKAFRDDVQRGFIASMGSMGGWLVAFIMPVDINKLNAEFSQAILGIKQAYNEAIAKLVVVSNIMELEALHSQILNLGSSPTGFDDWYWQWLRTIRNNPSMVTSLGMLFSQGPLELSVQEVNQKYGNVHFLPMYHLFIRQHDCFIFGQCWVANPLLYQDQIGHLNFLGYTIWASALSNKVVELNWHNSLVNGPPKFNGAVSIPGDDTVVVPTIDEYPPDSVVIHPDPIDIFIVICLFTGKCW